MANLVAAAICASVAELKQGRRFDALQLLDFACEKARLIGTRPLSSTLDIFGALGELSLCLHLDKALVGMCLSYFLGALCDQVWDGPSNIPTI